MRKQEAIERIKHHIDVHRWREPRAIYITEALEMAMDALDPWKPINGPKIPKKGEAVLVSTFGITTMAWVVSEPSEKLKFTILDPISHQTVYDPADKYQIRKWMPLPKGD